MGVTAAAPVAAAPAGGAAAQQEKKNRNFHFSCICRHKKINVIKEVRAITGLGLKKLRI